MKTQKKTTRIINSKRTLKMNVNVCIISLRDRHLIRSVVARITTRGGYCFRNSRGIAFKNLRIQAVRWRTEEGEWRKRRRFQIKKVSVTYVGTAQPAVNSIGYLQTSLNRLRVSITIRFAVVTGFKKKNKIITLPRPMRIGRTSGTEKR